MAIALCPAFVLDLDDQLRDLVLVGLGLKVPKGWQLSEVDAVSGREVVDTDIEAAIAGSPFFTLVEPGAFERLAS